MKLKEEFAAARTSWRLMTLYQKFEHAVILVLTAPDRGRGGARGLEPAAQGRGQHLLRADSTPPTMPCSRRCSG